MIEFDLSKPYCRYFKELTEIPHGSYNEKGVADWLEAFAKERGLTYVRDKMNNVVIYKNATAGYENAAPLLLQAHVDMVCEKNKSSNHDFEKDPLQLYVDGEWLSAKDTTLGADDGTGVAYMMAILAADDLEHPALECAFTVMEEVGLFGALGLDTSLFKARRMVSLDGGGEVSTAISSAGGTEAIQTIDISFEDNSDDTYRLFVTGLSGGHSGGEIHKEKGNSIKLAFRIIKEMQLKGLDVRLVSFDGGLKSNAIPRECEIIFTSKSSNDDILAAASKTIRDISIELEFSDPGFACTVTKDYTSPKHFDMESSNKVIDYIFLLPDGFKHRSMAIEGLTLTSLNLGILRLNDKTVEITSSIRSAIESGIDHLLDEITVLSSLFGFKLVSEARYPGWNYKANSDMRQKLNKVLMERNGKPLVEMAAHGGCECGVFAAISDEMDILTYGPIATDVHTPGERLNLPSFDRGYQILTDLIKECK